MKQNAEMYKRNQYAIRLMDEGEITQADKAFKDNCADFPCLISSVNYANSLLDEHCSTTPKSLIFNLFRKRKVKHLLSVNCDEIDGKSFYHAECVRGCFYYERFQLEQAKKHYEFALHLDSSSVEASVMLSWILFLMHKYEGSLSYLDQLAAQLRLGDDLRDNMEILFENCPFVYFPYYQLRVIDLYHAGLSETAVDLLNQLCVNSLSAEDALLPATDAVMMCLHLHHDRHLCQLVKKIASDPYTYNNEEIDQTIFFLLKAAKTQGDMVNFSRLLWKKTTCYSKLKHLVQFILTNKAKRLFRQVHAVRKECHFIGCPIHNP